LVGKARRQAKYGADLIKICATGGVLSKGDSVGGQQLCAEELSAIVVEAHRLDMKVAAHAHGTEGIKAALIAGVDTIEHASLIDDEGIKIAKAKGAVSRWIFIMMTIFWPKGPRLESCRNPLRKNV